MATAPRTARHISGAMVVLLVVAILLYAFTLANAAEAPYLESIDQGLAAIYAMIGTVLLWIVLGALLIMAAAGGAMPGWAGLAALLLHPLSGVAAVTALVMLTDTSRAPHWPIGVLIALPPLLALYAVWARQPRLHATLPANAISGAVLGAVLVVSIGLLGYVTTRDMQASRQAVIDRREYSARLAAEQLAKQQANLARFQRLTDDSPLAEWQEFIGKGNDLESQAVARVRTLAHRQGDAEAMLRDGNGFPLFHTSELDLHATPAFCAATSAFLLRNAAAHRPDVPDRAYILESDQFDIYLPAMRFLVGQHCDLATAISAMEDAVRAYPPAPEREAMLAALARLHSDWRACGGADDASAEQQIGGCTAVINTGTTSAEDLAVARFNRGGAHLDREQFDQAIADYSAAIGLKPDFAEAFNNRGNAYDDAGHDDQALQDYDEALRIAPGFAKALSNRGLLYDARGDHVRAIQDYDQALHLDPKYRGALKNRGRARFFQGDFAAAAQDFAQALALAPTDAYAVLWLDLAQGRAGQAAQANLRREAGALNRAEWPWPVVAALLGEQEVAAVQAGAQKSPDQDCDAGFYLGENSVLNSGVSVARELLQHARAVCKPNSVEYVAAKFELTRLRP
jgi:lipoprotein NlpI